MEETSFDYKISFYKGHELLGVFVLIFGNRWRSSKLFHDVIHFSNKIIAI